MFHPTFPSLLFFNQFSAKEKDSRKVFSPETFDDKRTDNPPIEKKIRKFIGRVSADVKIGDLKRRQFRTLIFGRDF